MWLPLLGLLLGFAVGVLAGWEVPDQYSSYLSIAILAAFDTLIGGWRAHLQGMYDETVFITGFFFNIILATTLTFLGVHLGVDLYLAAVFAFGVRLFQNIAIIRRLWLAEWAERRENREKS
ncbi:small basic protein [Geobacillus stearothermophilus]|nr:small basic protein [Geobacillus stearothermophilus]